MEYMIRYLHIKVENYGSAFKIANNKNNPIDVTKLDLDRHVFLPYIKNIVRCLLEACGSTARNYKKIFFSGKYALDPYLKFNLRCISRTGISLQFAALMNSDTVFDAGSRGAVSFGSNFQKNNVAPFFLEDSEAHALRRAFLGDVGMSNRSSAKWKAARSLNLPVIGEEYDFIVGIGKTLTIADVHIS